MNNVMMIIRAEIIKQHRNYFQSKTVYFSLLIWPVLVYLNTFYTYSSFDIEISNIQFGVGTIPTLSVFLVTGMMGYNFFWSMVQSAWQMGNERKNGTLEIIFSTPANRFGLIYGRALGALIENIWMFSVFGVLIIVVNSDLSINFFLCLISAFVILAVSSTIWGGLMNVIFLFSRDASFLFDLCDEPMNLFSGAKIPVEVFPMWAKIVSSIFPLTYCLFIIRKILVSGFSGIQVSVLINLVITLSVLVIATMVLLNIAEKNNRKSGNLILY